MMLTYSFNQEFEPIIYKTENFTVSNYHEIVKPELWQHLSQHFREVNLQHEEKYGKPSRIQAAVRPWRSYALCHTHTGFF